MTSPVVHGYPDYSRQTPESDVIFWKAVNEVVNAQTTKGPFFCGAFPAIGFRFSISVQNCRFTVRYFSDAAGTDFLGSIGIDGYTAQPITVTIPVLGPWFTVVIDVAAAGMQMLGACYAAPHANIATLNGSATNVLIAQPSVAVGAGVTVPVDATWMFPGEASWVPSSSLATYNVTLVAVDYLGNETDIDVATQVVNAQRRIVHLPYQRVRAKLTNTTGGPGAIGVRVTAHPSRIG